MRIFKEIEIIINEKYSFCLPKSCEAQRRTVRILRAKSLQSFKFSSIGRAGSCPKPIAGRDGGTGGGAHLSPDFGRSVKAKFF